MSRDVEAIFLRLKYLCSRYGRLVVIALVVVSSVALAGSAVAYIMPPETTQVTQQTDVQSFTTTVNTSAAVTGNTTLYDTDDQLANMPVYLLTASPEMTLQAHADVPDDRAVEVTQQVTMELYATRDDEIFWTETETLATDSQRITNGSLVTESTVNVSDIRRGRLREVQSAVTNVGTLHAKFHVDTVYNSDTYQGHLTVTTPVEITDRAYAVETPQSDEQSHSTPVTRTLTERDDMITFGEPTTATRTVQAGVGGGVVTLPKQSMIWGGLGVVGLFAAVVIWRFYTRTPGEEALKRQYDKTRYGEWISVGTVPGADTYQRVAIDGLTDLLDIAIDSNKRIIHDTEQSLYAVIDGTVIYEYNEAIDQLEAYIDVAAGDKLYSRSRDDQGFFELPSDDESQASVWDTFDQDTISTESQTQDVAPDDYTEDLSWERLTDPTDPQNGAQETAVLLEPDNDRDTVDSPHLSLDPLSRYPPTDVGGTESQSGGGDEATDSSANTEDQRLLWGDLDTSTTQEE